MKKKRRKSSYSRGYSWGKKTIKKAWEDRGHRGVGECDKASITCEKYGKDRTVKKTKKGKVLNEPLRAYYRGISAGMTAGYIEIFNG